MPVGIAGAKLRRIRALDTFGFSIHNVYTKLFVYPWHGGDLEIEYLDHVHGVHLGDSARLEMDTDNTYCLCDVVTARAVAHFVSRWRRVIAERQRRRRLMRIVALHLRRVATFPAETLQMVVKFL